MAGTAAVLCRILPLLSVSPTPSLAHSCPLSCLRSHVSLCWEPGLFKVEFLLSGSLDFSGVRDMTDPKKSSLGGTGFQRREAVRVMEEVIALLRWHCGQGRL